MSPRTNRVTWERVVTCLDDDKARLAAVAILTGRKIKGADMASNRLAREAVADALTAAEDALEGRRGQALEERAKVRACRRALELELWP